MAYGMVLGQTPKTPKANEVEYSNASTSALITSNNVQGAIDQLFTSVSNGKNKIAGAITDKGVSTSGTDSFDVMAGNIGKIPVGPNISSGLIDISDVTVFSAPQFVGKNNVLITPNNAKRSVYFEDTRYIIGALILQGLPSFCLTYGYQSTSYYGDPYYLELDAQGGSYDASTGQITTKYDWIPATYGFVAW